MCEYPHNPPVLCVKGLVAKKEVISHSKFKCLITLKVEKLVRPKNTYYFNNNLDKNVHIKSETLKKKKVDFYSSLNCNSNKIFTTLEYNCSDKYKKIKDLALIDLDQVNGKVLDQWTEKKHSIDCSALLSK